MKPKVKAVFLDRDGVLNKAVIKQGKPYPPATISEVEIPKDAAQALTNLKNAGFLLICITNQPDVARKITKQETVEEINKFLMKKLPLDDIFTCYHDDDDKCNCRKPLPGMLFDAAKKYNINLAGSIMIGDRWKDIEAGKNSGCKTIWISANYNESKPTSNPDYITTSLSKAASWILNRIRGE